MLFVVGIFTRIIPYFCGTKTIPRFSINGLFPLEYLLDLKYSVRRMDRLLNKSAGKGWEGHGSERVRVVMHEEGAREGESPRGNVTFLIRAWRVDTPPFLSYVPRPCGCWNHHIDQSETISKLSNKYAFRNLFERRQLEFSQKIMVNYGNLGQKFLQSSTARRAK